jgi:hypothetical protein
MKPRKVFTLLLLPAVFVVLIGSAYLLSRSSNGWTADLGSNLISEFIGAAVVVFGVDYLIKRRERTRLLPVAASSYEDVRLMTHWALDLWRTAYESSTADRVPSSWRELLADESIDKVCANLDISKPANILPPQPWAWYYDHVAEKIYRHAERVLERHGTTLDPEVHNAVYTMVYYGNHRVSQIQAIDRRESIPRPTNLGGYIPIVEEWFQAVLLLHEWTVKTHKYLLGNGVGNIHAPYEFRPLEPKTPPPAAFSPGEFASQAMKFQCWRERKHNEAEV